MKSSLLLIVTLSALIQDCRSDPQEPRRIKGQQHFYLAPSIYDPKDGVIFSYADDAELFQHIAHNCIEVYSGKDVIIFSNTNFAGSKDTSYGLVYTADHFNRVQLTKTAYNKKKLALEKITLPE